jgi:hypothetical protein
MRRGQSFELLLVRGQLLLQSGTLVNALAAHLLAQRRECGLVGLELADDCLAKLRHPFGDHNAICVQPSVSLMHQRRASPSQALAHPMERLDIVLLDVLRRHKTHRGPRHRFAHAFGIAHVVFVRLNRGFDKLGGHEFDFMMMCTESSSPVMRPATGLHTDEHGGQCGDEGHQGIAGEAFAQDDLAPSCIPTT